MLGGASKCWGVQKMLGGARMKLGGGAHPPRKSASVFRFREGFSSTSILIMVFSPISSAVKSLNPEILALDTDTL